MARIEDERGATTIEYGIVTGVLALAVVAGASLLGDRIDAALAEVTGSVVNAARKQDRGLVAVPVEADRGGAKAATSR